jgi:hypothetical protein
MTDTPTEGDLLGGSGAPFPIAHAGRTYHVAPPTVLARDALNKFVVGTALQAAQRADVELPGLGALDQFRSDYALKKYRPGGPKWKEWVNGEHGNALFLASLLYQHHPKEASFELAEELIRDQPDAVVAAFGEVIPGFFDLLAASPDLPPELRDGYRRAAEALRERMADAARLTPPAGSTSSSST